MIQKSFNHLDQAILDELKAICGEGRVLSYGSNLEKYSRDESNQESAEPDVVVFPEAASEVSRILELANKTGVPVTPRGTGTGVTGGAVPCLGGIVMAMERMNKILDIDVDNLMAVVEAGVITDDLKRKVEEKGLFYPPDPSSMDMCTIGGNLAECAGGAMAVKYGVTKDYVCGLEVVYPDGTCEKLGGKIVKNVAGYDLIQLLIGSEGTLGVITQVTLKLIPKPKYSATLLVAFNSTDTSACVVSEILKQKIVPAAMELLDERCICAVEKYLNCTFPYSKAKVLVLIRLMEHHESVISSMIQDIKKVCKQFQPQYIKEAFSSKEEDVLWKVRRSVRPALKALSPDKISEDIVVPRREISRAIKAIEALAKKHQMEIFCYGHAGDGNLHVQVLRIKEDEDTWRQKTPNVIKDIFRIAIDLGGTITAEHGIGLAKRSYLSMALGKKTLEIMKNIKEAFDPNGILNPGKIF